MTRDEGLAVRRAYRFRHRDEINARRRQKRRNPIAWRPSREYLRSYQVSHREERAAYMREWRAANPDKASHQNRLYKMRRRGATGTHTLAEWRDKCALLGNVCTYCGEARPLERDHRVPISRGGTNAITNIVPACKSCNSAKGTRTDREFITLRSGSEWR